MPDIPLSDLPLTLTDLRGATAAGLDPAALITECYRRIAAAADPGIFLHLVPVEQALADLAALGPAGPDKPLHGIPFAIKDNIDLAGSPTTAACRAFTHTPDRDAFVVARLRAAGAIPIGKTNLDQFATGLVGTRTPWPVPLNALDPAIVPGGSSSGSAVATARGLVAFALGTDTAGSGRVPAALNNIVGLKPSLGALSASGMTPACRTLDTISIFALTVPDAYEVFSLAAGFDPADAYSRRMATPPLADLPPRFRVGVPTQATRVFAGDAAQSASFDAALGMLAGQGAEIAEIDFTPFYDTAKMLYEGAWVAERYAAIEPLIRDRPEELLEVIRAIVGSAREKSAADAFRGFYRLAELKRMTDPLIDSVDLLCVPTMPTFTTLAEIAADPIGPNSRSGTYTNFVNLLDLCGLAVPMAPRRDGRPGGITLLARAGHDARLAALGVRLHELATVPLGATGWPLPPMPEPVPAPGPEETALAVVGAHMSGLPLNKDLAALGARFLRATHTAPGYRLYRLAGGPPARPGLVRDPGGGAIALEIWALPTSKVGAFLARVPPPLCIGTVALEDGGAVKGFLCEPGGLPGAEEITEHGGWRAYLKAS